jgi:microcin C transport system substrate-binding protein
MKYRFRHIINFFILILILSFIGCSDKNRNEPTGTNPVSIKTIDTPEGADASVSADNGGAGFTGVGWTTNNNFNTIGKKDAVKGGRFSFGFSIFPATLRIYGKDSNFDINEILGSLLYESLLGMDPVNGSLMPMLATHWKISDDSTTYSFRLDPDARWADGAPVTTADVIATLKFLSDPELLSPPVNQFVNSFEEPIAVSKYIFSIKTKVKDWRQIYYISSISILPGHILKNLSAKNYLEEYQYKYLVGSGPYVILPQDIKKGESLVLRRRSDYWAENKRENIGKNNFDELKMSAVTDDNLQFEMFKKGDIDYYYIRQIELLKTGFDFDLAKRNLVIKKKVPNYEPMGINGLTFNLRREPFDDIRVRRALYYLFDREKMNTKLFDSSFTLFNTYFPNTDYSCPSNPITHYNADSAMILLNSAGWKRNPETGILEKNGKPFEVQIPITKNSERYMTIYQEDLRNAGIKLNLKIADGITIFTLGDERNFSILPVSWVGLLIENPESMFNSENASQSNTNNWSGIQDKTLDSLCVAFKYAYSPLEQKKILTEIDCLAYSKFAFIDGFYRIDKIFAYQNKFSFPDGIIGKFDRLKTILAYWSIDPKKYSLYKKALEDKSISLPSEEFINNYWRENRTK